MNAARSWADLADLVRNQLRLYKNGRGRKEDADAALAEIDRLLADWTDEEQVLHFHCHSDHEDPSS